MKIVFKDRLVPLSVYGPRFVLVLLLTLQLKLHSRMHGTLHCNEGRNNDLLLQLYQNRDIGNKYWINV